MTPEMPDEKIRCWACGATWELGELFDRAEEILCQPVCDGFSVKCPNCREELWLAFSVMGTVSVAQVIGFGARPDLLDYQVVNPGAAVDVDYENRTIRHAGKVWSFR